MIDLESLNCFLAAAQRLNFRAAARQVHLSPAAFSDRIQRLEDDLGVKLFIRSTRRVRLSPNGERLLPQALRAITEANKCREMVDQETDIHLNIGTRYELGHSLVLPTVEKLHLEHPNWKIHLVFGDSRSLMSDLRKGEIDAVIGSMRLTMSDLEYMPLHEEEYRFVGTKELLDDTPMKDSSCAQNHILVDISSALPLFRYWLDQGLKNKPWRFKQARYMGTIAAMKRWITIGNGIGVLPEYFIRKELENGSLVEIMPQTRPRSDWFRLIWLKDHPREPELVKFGQRLKEEELC